MDCDVVATRIRLLEVGWGELHMEAALSVWSIGLPRL